MPSTNDVKTRKGLAVDEVMSAMQKAIRRGQVMETIGLALEYHASWHRAVWTGRYLVYLHEDIGLASPATALYVDALRQYALGLPDAGKGLMGQAPVAYAAMAMARAPKSRRAVSCHLLVYEDNFQSQYEADLRQIADVENCLAYAAYQGEELETVHWASILETEFRTKPYGYQRVWDVLQDVAMTGRAVNTNALSYIQMCKRHYTELLVAGKPENLCLINAALMAAKARREVMTFDILDQPIEGVEELIGYINNASYMPTIPDEALDKHTARGKRMGRDIVHFQEVGAYLANEVIDLDPDKEAAYTWGRTSKITPRYKAFLEWVDTNRPRQQGTLL